MARPIWSGVITFGLVTVPVQMFAAVENHTVRFHQLQRGTGDRVRNRRVNERTGKHVDSQDIVKGYDLGDGEYVVVEPEELAEIAPGRSRSIEVSGFVELADVDPAFFDRTYYLAPRGEEYGKVYELLRGAMAEAERIGVATFVMHGKEYLVALRAGEEVLSLHTLHWADEVRDPEDELPFLPARDAPGNASRGARGKESKTARQLVEAMSTDWRPEAYEDTYETKVHRLVEAKRKGEEIATAEEPPEATNVIDLSEALRRSVDEAGSKSSGSSRSSRSSKSPNKSSKSSKSPKSSRGTRGAESSGSSRSSKSSGTSKSPRNAGSSKGAGSPGKAKGAKRAGGGRGRGGRREELAALSKRELYERATAENVPGRSKMSRAQLADALGAHDIAS